MTENATTNTTTPTNLTATGITRGEAAENTETTNAPRTRKPREKIRPLDVLKGVDNLKSLSDKEKNILIEHYRAELNKVSTACSGYKANAEEAFKKARMLEDAYNHNIAVNNAKLDDMVQAVRTLYKTIFLMAKDGKQND
jgi:hypothetical protein